MNPYTLPLRVLLKNKQQRGPVAGPTPVPNLDDVQPFMSVPEFVVKPGSELEALLTSPHIQNPYPYPGNIDVLTSYKAEPPESASSKILGEHVKHALAHIWKYDPSSCSVKGAFKLDQDLLGKPNHGLTKNEYKWATRQRLKIAKKARCAAHADVERTRDTYKWQKNWIEDDEVHSLDGSDLDKELDDFYGPDGTDIRPIDDDTDEGFSEPSPITTTIVSLPEKSLMEEGITPGGIFQDSGICMDEDYAQYSLAHSLPNTAREYTRTIPSDWPTFKAAVAPLRTPKKTGRWLGLVGDEKQTDWPGRRQGPYDLHGFGSHRTSQMVDGPKSKTIHRGSLPSEVMIQNEPMQQAQAIFEPVQEKSYSEPSEAISQSFCQEQPPLLPPNIKNPITNEELQTNGKSRGATYSPSEERPQILRDSVEEGTGNGPFAPAPHAMPRSPQINNDANSHNIPNTSFTTPMNQRTRPIQQIQVAIPTTPETINIHLSPEDNNDADTGDVLDGSFEVRVPISPTMNTQKGQSALGRYVQETQPHLVPLNSSTMSLDGSESEEDPLISTQKHPGHPEGHAGFSKAVEFHQRKSDAVFTLSPPTAPQRTPSPKKTAPLPITPAYLNGAAPFRPITPFQLDTPAHRDLDSPGTPTPAPKASNNKAKGKSVKDVFRSPKLGSQSPERAPPDSSPIVVVDPTTPLMATTKALDSHRGSSSSFGGRQGLLFQPAKRTERGTKNVLSSLKLVSSERRGSGGARSEEHDKSLDDDDYQDELAAGPSGTNNSRAKRGRKVAQTSAIAVSVPRVRSRDENEDEGMLHFGQGPLKKVKKKATTTIN